MKITNVICIGFYTIYATRKQEVSWQLAHREMHYVNYDLVHNSPQKYENAFFFFTVYFFANLSRKLSVLKTVFKLEGTILKTELFENEDITITACNFPPCAVFSSNTNPK